ncbi:LacI family DNA-binding transcriptional regulator [Anaerocolumna sp. MB42-C2]|uniref:LacI family DNA-binding transcriptional regulator n=1 Tax=Anaerocolumna sp. MB42-C2 TaxID=3070997 RepID=UPI0027DFCB98|nr:LacI family DNA-binding transcriptional regulator [Anaerocolumna sp. MB42-C2]WMJ89005.1 LacI family DNA-binding transcriptional regulator [Anaerocolumna sp. MB42-C2]
MKNDKIKLSDIANVLGISSISVSRALSGQGGVSDELREKVITKAKEMGYLKVRSLEQKRVLVLHQKPFIQDNSNFSHIMQGMEKALQDANLEYDMEFTDKKSQADLILPNKIQKGANYDGLIFIGGFDNSYMDCIIKKIKNYVCYTGYSPSKNCDCVWYNFNNGSYKQCEFLIEKGHKKIGYLGNNKGYVSREKVLGISLALENHNLEIWEEYYFYSEENYGELLDMIRQNNGPTAIICQWDYTALKLIKYLHDNGVKVPEDISVMGYGNTEMSALCIPALTTMEIHIDYACQSTVGLLLKRFGISDKPCENIMIHSTLVERDSVKFIK